MILITGAAGFIGAKLTELLLREGQSIIGIDSLNAYYDVSLKQARLARLTHHKNFIFHKLDLADRAGITELFKTYPFTHVINLAAQAGVRYSLSSPTTYIDSNVVGFGNILEACRHSNTLQHLVFASSSSVYGANTETPFAETQTTDQPLSLYAATKKANESMAYSYAHLYHLPCSGLRYFSVYGPWGRPDSALFKFSKNILEGHEIEVFSEGNMYRDFTYIDDIVTATRLVLKNPPTSPVPLEIYNVGCGKPVKLTDFIDILENKLEKKAIRKLLPTQACEMHITYSDITKLKNTLGFQPQINLAEGVEHFVDWYKEYYSVFSE